VLIVALVIWAAVVAAACFLAVGLLVGQALARHERPGAKRVASLILAPGLMLAEGQVALSLFISWLVWTIAGGVVVAGVVGMTAGW